MRPLDALWNSPARIFQTDRVLGWIRFPHVLVICVLLAIASAAFHRGGFANPEMEIRMPFYLAERPLLNKLFDSKHLDYAGGLGGEFQGRELSYVFDILDSKFIAWSVSIGVPHFFSLTHYVFAFLIAFLIWRFSVHGMKASPWIGAGLVLIFWTSPAVFLGGVYFRTAKIGVALMVAVLCSLILPVLSNPATSGSQRLPARTGIGFFTASLSAMLFDMQGIYLVGTAIAVLLIWVAFVRSRNAAILLGACVASLVAAGLYRYWWAPSLTFSLSHYWPDTTYQSLPWANFLHNPLFYVIAGLSLCGSTLSGLLGNIPIPVFAGIVAGLVACLAILLPRLIRLRLSDQSAEPDSREKTSMTVAVALIVSNALLVWAMNSLMVLRHEPLVWPDVRLTYYWLPAVTLHSMTLAFLLAWLHRKSPFWRNVLPVVMAAVIVSNAIAIPAHETVAERGHMQKYMESGPALLEALRQLRNPAFAPPPSVQQDSIYQFFRNSLASK